jgi:hypothetical protein
MRVTNAIPLGCGLLLSVDTVKCIQTLKVMPIIDGLSREFVYSPGAAYACVAFGQKFALEGCH